MAGRTSMNLLTAKPGIGPSSLEPARRDTGF